MPQPLAPFCTCVMCATMNTFTLPTSPSLPSPWEPCQTSRSPWVECTSSEGAATQTLSHLFTAEQQATYETNRDKALGMITYYTSTLIRQNLMNKNDPHNAWEQLNTSYRTPGTAGVFVEFKHLTQMMIQGNQDPAPAVNQMQSTIGYLASNSLTLPNSTQAMLLLGTLPNDWQGFASTLLATLHVNPTAAQIAAGVQQLTFDSVLPKIMEEWSRKSGKPIMPSLKEQKEQNMQAGPSCPRCKKCSGHHSTVDHCDDYKKMFTPNATAGPSTFPPKNQGGGKGKGGGKKGKGK